MSNEEKTVYSIHGNCVRTGKQSPTVYNTNPQENKSPSTPRGKRRLSNKNKSK